MNKFVSTNFLLASLVVAIAIVCALDLIQAQKTAANSYQQQISGSGSNSVYGGYQSSPVNQKRRNSQQPNRPNRKQPQQQSYNQQQQSYNQQRQQPAPQEQQQEQQTYSSSSSSSSASYEQQNNQQAEADAEPAQYGSVNGQPGVDFPNYARVPKTSFTCDDKPYEYGMYADEETQCQAFHVCFNGRRESFLCGTGTVFNQRILHCDYWYSVNCGKSSQYYGSNAYMGSSQPEPGPAEAGNFPAQLEQATYSSKRTEVSQQSPNRPVNNRPVNYGGNQQASSSFNKNTQQQVQESY